ncbi:hypothetical protein AtNW77_Chr2g0230761 [Arabidopsis thaliana]
MGNFSFIISGISSSLYANISKLFDLTQHHGVLHNVRFVNPWIMWSSWKNMNKLLFGGISSMTTTIADKAFDNHNQWFLAQPYRHEDEKIMRIMHWSPPLPGDLKCNIGFEWSKQHQFLGASWAVRDSQGTVLFHSRRSFAQVFLVCSSLHLNMVDVLWDEIQNLELGQDYPTLFIPNEAYVMVEDRNRLSLIARPLLPRVQNFNAVINALPRAWGLTAHVHGRILDATYVQLLFQTEIYLLSVQRREVWLFNNWFVASQRWEAAPSLNFVTTIDLWVQMRGIPILYVFEKTELEIAQELGEIISLDFHDATSTQIAYIRVRVRFGITDRLRFFQRITFESGETALIRFQYERLRRICSCFRFTHNLNYYPYRQRFQSIDRERAVFRDSVLRSSFNSQSQMTDSSLQVPLHPPPRVPSSGDAITSGIMRVLEVGESSRGVQDGESHNNMNLGSHLRGRTWSFFSVIRSQDNTNNKKLSKEWEVF